MNRPENTLFTFYKSKHKISMTRLILLCQIKREEYIRYSITKALFGDSCTGILMLYFSYKHAFNKAVNCI